MVLFQRADTPVWATEQSPTRPMINGTTTHQPRAPRVVGGRTLGGDAPREPAPVDFELRPAYAPAPKTGPNGEPLALAVPAVRSFGSIKIDPEVDDMETFEWRNYEDPSSAFFCNFAYVFDYDVC
jgi:hypothetical protein